MKKEFIKICEELKRLTSDIQYAGESNNEELVYVKLKQIKKSVDKSLSDIEKELEVKEEADILCERIDNLEKDPSSAVSWGDVRRSGR